MRSNAVAVLIESRGSDPITSRCSATACKVMCRDNSTTHRAKRLVEDFLGSAKGITMCRSRWQSQHRTHTRLPPIGTAQNSGGIRPLEKTRDVPQAEQHNRSHGWLIDRITAPSRYCFFLMFKPLTGRREVLVTERRTVKDDPHTIRHLTDVVDPTAEKFVLVQDHLNTHKLAALYAAFPPATARRQAGASRHTPTGPLARGC